MHWEIGAEAGDETNKCRSGATDESDMDGLRVSHAASLSVDNSRPQSKTPSASRMETLLIPEQTASRPANQRATENGRVRSFGIGLFWTLCGLQNCREILRTLLQLGFKTRIARSTQGPLHPHCLCLNPRTCHLACSGPRFGTRASAAVSCCCRRQRS